MTSTSLTDLNKDDFCNEAVLSVSAIQAIHDLCAKVIEHGSDRTKEQIGQIYKAWKKHLDEPVKNGPIRYYPNKSEEGIWTLAPAARDGLNAAVKNTKHSVKHYSAMRDDSQGGVDFPIWFSAKEGCGKPRRVMIIAQDPLRKEKDFQRVDSPNEERIPGFLIGTPFALHDIRFRRQGNGDNYWDIINALRHKNCHVYVTDLFKVYQRGVDLSKGDIALPFFRNLLHTEAKIFEPDLIVTFGRKACQALGALMADESFRNRPVFDGTAPNHQLRHVELSSLTGSVSKYRILPLLHPSGSARGSRDDFRDANEVALKDCNGSMFTHLILRALDMAWKDKSNADSNRVAA